ncbi:hypothetical protein KA005_78505, partial [bacterium]|nr:hypothetical protein [bacterium]
RSPEDDYGALELFNVMLEQPEFLSDAIKMTDNIRDHEKRANTLLILAVKHYNIGQIQKVEKLLSAALRISENIEDDTKHELMKFRIYTMRTKIQAGDKIGKAYDSLSPKRERDFPSWFSGDSAMPRVASSPGGIDLNPRNIDIKTRGDGIKIQFPSFNQNLPINIIDGFVPVIINITPITNIPFLLGVESESLKEPQLTRL